MFFGIGLPKLFSKKTTAAPRIPQNLIDLLRHKDAGLLHGELKVAVTPNWWAKAELLSLAADYGWPALELEKLMAYIEFFSGEHALAYQRVMEKNLAENDFLLYMTACVYCYLNDRFVEGYALIKKFDLRQHPDFNPEDFFPNAGYAAYAGSGNIGEAVAYFDQATELTPILASNAAMIYFAAKDFSKVEELKRFVHESCPDDQTAVYALSLIELARDYYPEGFRLAESRYLMPGFERSANSFLLALPRWRGESLQGKRIFIHGEQGIGDVIMMARYFSALLTRAESVIVDVHSPLISLLEFNFPQCSFVERDVNRPIDIAFDHWTGVMSLPFCFDTVAYDVPGRSGYLAAPEEQKNYWAERISGIAANGAPRIGIAWSGNPSHRYDQIRSIDFSLFANFLREFPEIQFFALQTAVPAVHPGNLLNCSDELLTLADTAALIEGMDLVITIDTSIVHLAGALGKETWLLLPYRYEWRWSLEGEQNNWYDSVRVFRQVQGECWDDLLGRVFGQYLKQWQGGWGQAL